jgi:glycosidase
MKILLLTFTLCFSFLSAYSQVPLTFQVDMSEENIQSEGVHVAGTFQDAAGYGNNWNPGGTPLSDPDGDQIYELTVMVPPGTYLYKFVNGNDWGDKPELPSPDCSVGDGGGNFNRQVTVGSQGAALPLVKFDSCNAILHLSVNMKNEQVATPGVYVMGNFQEAAGYPANWDPTSVPMEDTNNDGTYEVRIPVPPGTYEYLFVNGNTLNAVEAPGTDCTIENAEGTQVRSQSVAVGDAPGLIYCFNSCDICDPAFNTEYETYWWNDAVFYEIYVRSFYDSDGDGTGDFRGVIEKLDYLNDGDPETDTDLGITGIWLMPMMESPSVHGYDVTNYYATEPDYGTMEDFEALLDACHDRGIKVIIDFVMNHCSNQHPWFTQSAGNQNGYREWFRWSDNNPGYNGPWGQNVWHFQNGDYYYGLFWGGMPDLNYSHPPVKETMFEIAEFWLDKGVDGFRLDAIKYLDEDGSQLENTPETFQLLEDFHILYKNANPEAFTVGEVWSNTASVIPYIQEERLDVCFEFDLAYGIINAVNNQNPAPIQQQLQTVQSSYPRLQYATFLTNHDIDRIYSQLGGNSERMKQAASIYLTLPGIPFIYYGEEVGMFGSGPHENIRAPMQWAGDVNGGFSDATPWFPLGSGYTTNNVESQSADPQSLLSHYRQLVHLRNEHEALRKGYLLNVEEKLGPASLSYARIHESEAIIMVSNLSEVMDIQPLLSMPASTLPPGTYRVKELRSQSDWGTVEISVNGGLIDWAPYEGSLPAADSWMIQLVPEGTSSTHALHNSLDVKLFPNPATQYANVSWDKRAEDQAIIQVFNTSGQQIYTARTTRNEEQIRLKGWAKGLYFVRIQSGAREQTIRLMVE